MSTFKVEVVKVRDIEPIANADAIECAVVGDYRSVVLKHSLCVGQLAVYIPEASVLPENVLRMLNMWDNEKKVGKLSGKKGNRVKAIKLRGQLSQGLLLPVDSGTDIGHPFLNVIDYVDDNIGTMLLVEEGDDLTAELGITKYEPPIPSSMAGEVYHAGSELTVKYDIENFKRYPDVLVEGEQVVMTEKLHGTFCGVGILPQHDADDKHFESRFVIFSKGLGADGLCFKDTQQNRETNVYCRTLVENGVLENLLQKIGDWKVPVFVLGEVFGPGIQDLSYGIDKMSFRVFDVIVGYHGNRLFLDHDEVLELADKVGISHVPILYEGPFSKQTMLEFTDGKETVSGDSSHVREGVVIKPTVERTDGLIGRVILKSVSGDYLTRKGKATEYQ